MKLSTEKQIEFVVDAQMKQITKMRKVDLQEFCRSMLLDYMRELHNDTIREMYDEVFFGVK